MAKRGKINFGSGKVEDLKSVNLNQGETHYLGSSSSPDMVYIENIGRDKITYRQYPFYPEDKLTRKRDITEDLIAEGDATMRKKREQMKDRYDDYAQKSKNYIGRKTNLKEIQPRRIVFRVSDSVANSMSSYEIEKKYKKYGLETNLGQGGNKYKTTVTREQLSKIKELPEIKVLESKKPSR